MSSIYLLILLVYAVNAKFALMPDGSIREVADDYDANTTSLTGSTAADQESSQKPHVVMTFIAKEFVRNTNQSDQPTGLQVVQNNQTQLQPLDPLQQLLQFFFSGVMRDMQPFEKREHSEMERSVSNNNRSNGRCEHGRVIFCTKCRLRFYNKTTASDKRSPSTRATTNKNMVLLPEENKRHYFLSISGGSHKRAAAARDSDDLELMKHGRNRIQHVPGSDFDFISNRLRKEQLLVDDEIMDSTAGGLRVVRNITERHGNSLNFVLSVLSMPLAIVISILVIALIFITRSAACGCRSRRGLAMHVPE